MLEGCCLYQIYAFGATVQGPLMAELHVFANDVMIFQISHKNVSSQFLNIQYSFLYKILDSHRCPTDIFNTQGPAVPACPVVLRGSAMCEWDLNS